MRRLNAGVVLFAAGLLAGVAPAQETRPAGAVLPEPELIPREILFGNPERAAPQLSSDGKWISYLAAVNNVMNVWVAPADDLKAATPVTTEKTRGIRQYFWAFDNKTILYMQDAGGDENWKVYAVDVASRTTRDLTPFESIPGPDGNPLEVPGGGKLLRPAAQIMGVSDRAPAEILIGLNNRNPQFHDVYRVNIETGDMKMVFQNDRFVGVIADEDYNVRMAMEFNESGGSDLFRVTKSDTGFEFSKAQSIGFEDAMTTNPGGYEADGKSYYMVDTRNRDTAALVLVDDATGKATVIAEDAKADVGETIAHPATHKVQAAAFTYDRRHWKVLDQSIADDLKFLASVSDGEMSIADRTKDDSRWIVTYVMDDGPVRFYLYDRAAKSTRFLFTNRPALEGRTLAKMHPVIIKSRDGLDLVSYLSLPPSTDTDNDGRPDRPLAMILNVHGGPWARDEWGYDGEHQWMTNRGYAVLSVNFRGSTGFGKNFINKADREWGGKMHDDLIDAVKWAVDQKIADASRVAIYGGSYGGYAALVGMTFTPETFACGVDIVGVANLNTFMSTIPPYWAPFLEQMKRRVGDFSTEEGRAFLADRSPVGKVDNIKRPLLIAQGANDPRVNKDESDQMVRHMQAQNIPVTYVLYPDEGHGFARPENRMSFYAVAEGFLAQHLGGRYEPIGDDFKNSTIQAPAGGEQIPGLIESLPPAPAGSAN